MKSSWFKEGSNPNEYIWKPNPEDEFIIAICCPHKINDFVITPKNGNLIERDISYSTGGKVSLTINAANSNQLRYIRISYTAPATILFTELRNIIYFFPSSFDEVQV